MTTNANQTPEKLSVDILLSLFEKLYCLSLDLDCFDENNELSNFALHGEKISRQRHLNKISIIFMFFK